MIKVLEMLKLYCYLAVFMFLLYKFVILSDMGLYMFMLLLLLGVLLDKSFMSSSKLMSVLFIVMHLLLYKLGLMESELLFMKELFWYSLALLGGFIWHVLMLNWLYILCEYMKWDYGCYMMSSFSLLTSLMWLLWMDELMMLKMDSKFDNIASEFYNYYPKYSLKDLGKTFNFMWFNEYDKCYCMLMIFYAFYHAILYLSMMFQSYTKMLMKGFGFKLKLSNMPWWVYLFFMSTLMLSVMLMTPRIYMMWVVLMVWNLSLMMKEMLMSYEKNKNYFINYKDSFKHQSPNNAMSSYFTLVVMLPIIGVFTDKHYKWSFEGKGNIMEYKDTLTKNWLEFYTYGLVKDYMAVSSVYHWYESSVMLEGDDMMEVIFEYLEESYEKMAASMALNYSIKGTFYVFDMCEEDDMYADMKSVKVFWMDKDVDMLKVSKYYMKLLKSDLMVSKKFYENSEKSWLKEKWWLEEGEVGGVMNKEEKDDD